MIIIEGKTEIERVRIFQGFKISNLKKRDIIADNWVEVKQIYQIEKIEKQFKLGIGIQTYLDKLKNGKFKE